MNVAVQVQQGVHLDSGLAPAKLRPRKQRRAQVDGGRIQSVQTLLQIDANRMAGMQRPGDGRGRGDTTEKDRGNKNLSCADCPEQFWWHYFAGRVPQAHI